MRRRRTLRTTVRHQTRAVTDCSVADLFASRFPSPDLVDAAAAMFPGLPRWDGSESARSFRLEVGPGSVGLAVKDPSRAERRKDNTGLGPLTTNSVIARLFANDPHVDAVLYGTSRAMTVGVPDPCSRCADPRTGLGVSYAAGSPCTHRRSPHGVVTHWSARSRSRMVRHLSDVDYRPVVRAGVP